MDWRKLRSPAFVVTFVLLFGAAAGLQAAVSGLKLYLRKLPIEVDLQIASIPTETTHWRRVGTDHQESAEMLEELGTKNYLTRLYEEKVGSEARTPRRLQIHLAYYTGMIDTVPHVPERCMVGGGWTIAQNTVTLPIKVDVGAWPVESGLNEDEFGVVRTARITLLRKRPIDTFGNTEEFLPAARSRLPRDVEGLTLRITTFLQPGRDARMHAGYFFLANGAIAKRAEDVRLLAFDLKADYAYYLKVQVSSTDVNTPEELADAAASLMNDLLPEIMLCVPDWVEVKKGLYPPDNPRRPSGLSGAPRA